MPPHHKVNQTIGLIGQVSSEYSTLKQGISELENDKQGWRVR